MTDLLSAMSQMLSDVLFGAVAERMWTAKRISFPSLLISELSGCLGLALMPMHRISGLTKLCYQ